MEPKFGGFTFKQRKVPQEQKFTEEDELSIMKKQVKKSKKKKGKKKKRGLAMFAGMI